MARRKFEKTNTEVATTSGSTEVGEVNSNPFLDAVNDIGSSTGNYLRFSGKDGRYTEGVDSTPVDNQSQLAVNMEEFKIGWICWKDDEVVGEEMGKVVEGYRKPNKGVLEDHGPYAKGDGWKEQASVVFRNIDNGDEYVFKISSASGVNTMRALLADYAKSFPEHPGEVMVIEIDIDTFESKDEDGRKQKNYKPVFEVVGWMSEDELLEIVGESAGDNEEDYDEEVNEENLVDDNEEGEVEEVEEVPKEDKKESSKAGGSKSITGRKAGGRKNKRF